MERIPMTADGYARLVEELKDFLRIPSVSTDPAP